jgi:hypothetical protein
MGLEEKPEALYNSYKEWQGVIIPRVHAFVITDQKQPLPHCLM